VIAGFRHKAKTGPLVQSDPVRRKVCPLRGPEGRIVAAYVVQDDGARALLVLPEREGDADLSPRAHLPDPVRALDALDAQAGVVESGTNWASAFLTSSR
jgi:hypothetical protein